MCCLFFRLFSSVAGLLGLAVRYSPVGGRIRFSGTLLTAAGIEGADKFTVGLTSICVTARVGRVTLFEVFFLVTLCFVLGFSTAALTAAGPEGGDKITFGLTSRCFMLRLGRAKLAFTVRTTLVLCVRLPEVPVMTSGYLPGFTNVANSVPGAGAGGTYSVNVLVSAGLA